MKILMIARSTLYEVFGGDSVQIESTAKYLRKDGIEVDIKLTHEKLHYDHYDLLHFFNIIRPADILKHVRKSKKPFVVSTIFVDFSEYEQNNRMGAVGQLTRFLSGDKLEYAKAIARWIKNGERIQSLEYLLCGHRFCVKKVAMKSSLLLPNSFSEYERFRKRYDIEVPFQVIYNGIDPEIISEPGASLPLRNEKLVLCVGRIEGNKNQLNLIRALNNSEYTLYIIGKPAPNHARYFEACKKEAAANIQFKGFVQPAALSDFYRQAKVHALPSWNETCGLASLEAAYHGCNIVITDKGDTAEYYGKHAWYCNPTDPASIFNAVDAAAKAPLQQDLKQKIEQIYNWEKAATDTIKAYRRVLATVNPKEKNSGL